MIGLDTNVIARVVLADDAVQTKQALALLESCQSKGEVVAISLSVILELEWVLRSGAKLSKQAVITLMRHLLETAFLQIENEAVLEQALYLYDSSKADFAECLFCAQYQRMGCRSMASFDEKAQAMSHVDNPRQLMTQPS